MDLLEACWLFTGTICPSCLVAWAAVFVVRRQAERWGLVDKPSERKVHLIPTPLGGGIGIWCGVLGPVTFGTLYLSLLSGTDAESFGLLQFVPTFALEHVAGLKRQLVGLWVLLGGATIIMLIGLADDRRGLRWQLRLGLQFAVVAACVSWQGWRLTAFIPLHVVTWMLSILWIVAMINSFNMLDNMDGLAGGVAAIAAGILAVVLLINPASAAPQIFVAGFLLVLVGALLGFLLHNRPPAKIFMGDAGSYFVGFCIAVCTLLATFASSRGDRPWAVFSPLCVMAVPLYDMTTVIWIRLREGRSPFHADKNHFSHRLVELGLSKGQAVLTIYLTTATCGLGALLLPRVDWVGALIVLSMVGSILALIAILEASARRKLNS